MRQQIEWNAAGTVESAALSALERAWHGWTTRDAAMPSRALFDPMDFPELLPWMLLGEIVERPNAARAYDVLFRYVGRELAIYFEAPGLTRMHLSELGAPYDERWFAVHDAPLRGKAPSYFRGAPLGTEYDYVPLEILTLPLGKVDLPQIGFVLCAFARLEAD
jgi:hypothetical protein